MQYAQLEFNVIVQFHPDSELVSSQKEPSDAGGPAAAGIHDPAVQGRTQDFLKWGGGGDILSLYSGQ